MVNDVIEFPILGRRCVVISSEFRLSMWMEDYIREARQRSYWRISHAPLEVWTGAHHQVDYTGIHYGDLYTFVDDVSPLVVDYSSVACPFALLSASLILWKPRTRASQN